jgi:mannosyl-3-phosphoglycerate phosphatase
VSREPTKKFIIFTDLDGTLLDYSTYSFESALPTLQMLREKDIPLIICSSKTRREIEYYRKKLDNSHPFISENGGGIFIPRNYFEFTFYIPLFIVKVENNYHVIRLGSKYSDLRAAIEALRREGFKVRSFGDMTVREIAEIANMSTYEAEMAKVRDFDEAFIFEGDEEETQRLLDAIRAKGFNHTQGRFFHILGDSDKGKAVSILIELCKKKFGKIKTVAIGDNPNDIPMLEMVDYPVIVQKPNGTYDPRIDIPNVLKAGDVGPEGWSKAVLALVSQID